MEININGLYKGNWGMSGVVIILKIKIQRGNELSRSKINKWDQDTSKIKRKNKKKKIIKSQYYKKVKSQEIKYKIKRKYKKEKGQ